MMNASGESYMETHLSYEEAVEDVDSVPGLMTLLPSLCQQSHGEIHQQRVIHLL